MSHEEGGDSFKPIDLKAKREGRQEEVVHKALVAREHAGIAREEKNLTEVLRPAFLQSFSEKYRFKNHQMLFALSGAIRRARSEGREYVYIREDQEGISDIEQLATEMAKDIDAGPDEAAKSEAVAILKHFFTHPAFRSLNVAFQEDIEGGVLLNWRT